MAIKNVGEAAVDAIIAERNANGDFIDLEDLLNRVSGVNINTVSYTHLTLPTTERV